MAGAEIQTYPDLVDAVWEIVKGTEEQRERSDYQLSEQRVAEALGLTWAWSDDACVDGIAQAISDLVDLGYCVGRGTFNGSRYMAVSPAPDAPDMPPSAYVLRDGLAKLPDLRAKALRFIHEQTLRQESGITFYTGDVRILFPDAVRALLPDRAEEFSATGDMVEALRDLKKREFVRGPITMGAFHMRVSLRGACWLQVAAPLLDLLDRATKFANHPEAPQAARLIMDAHARSESDAARDITVAIETLENAVGGERELAKYISKSKPFVGDLKQSAQIHRHAATHGREVLNGAQRLARAREIMDLYLTQCANSP